MSAAERVVTQLKARRIRENEYKARCPVHQGKSDTSLSIKHANDRVLIHCHAGCELKDILAVLGMSAAGLFDSVGTKSDPASERRSRAWRGLDIWCGQRLIHVCKILRELDYNIGLSSAALAAFEDGRRPRDPGEEDSFWSLLTEGYEMRADLQYEFEILNGRDTQAKVDLWRRYR